MAEQVPYGVATSLMNTLASAAFREIASIYGVKSDIKKLKQTVAGIKAVLADADQKRHTDELIKNWIGDLKEVLYEADDLLDEVQTHHLLRQRDAKGKRRVKVKVCYFFSSFNPIALRLKIARKIRNIREKFNDVAETMSKLNLDRRVVVEMKPEKSNCRETSSFVLEKDIVGREESVKEVVCLLLNNNNNNNNENVSLVAIVGTGGLGKTALAQLVYKNADVERSFNKRMWVCVSEDFDVKGLIKKILQLDGDKSLEFLQNELQQNLHGQKFLLVLDDVWNEDREKWLALKNYLMCGAEGSKILVTTRDEKVADIMGVKTPYVLKRLKDDQSWTLLKRLAFDQDQIMTPNLESIGQDIAKNCVGVPLAIRVMGSLLRKKSREGDWEAILKYDFWNLCQRDNPIKPILKLSYDSLAIELKQCFVYCSLYPKDWRYEKDELIDLWMAQGFLEDKDEKQCPEDVGEEYVYTLLSKSFLQDVETNKLGEIKYFKMHDLMHDLSQSVANFDYCPQVEKKKSVARFPIHASSFEIYSSENSLNMLDPTTLRTLLEMEKEVERNPHDLLLFKRLRSLDLSSCEMTYLPKSIGKMIHLRYLNLSDCSELTCLPKSICNLVNLQTLKLDGCENLKFSGDIITKLINLRRLDIQSCKAFRDGMPVGLGNMTSLQSLSNFIVGSDDKEKKKAQLNELKDLNLIGELTIENLDSVREVEEESKDVNLRTKEKLISLTLEWTLPWKLFNEMKNSDAMQLLENLRPHKNLKLLRITTYPGECLSDWILSCTNLVELTFSRLRNCQYLPALEGLVSLKTLQIYSMDKLEYIDYKGCSPSTKFFPSLEELEIKDCGSLRGWRREADGDLKDYKFSRLSSLQIWGCRNLSCMPTFPNLVKHLGLSDSSTKPLLDTLDVSAIGPSTSNDMVASLSKLKSLDIGEIDMKELPDKWMQNLSSLKELTICKLSSPEKLFHHMRNLYATLKTFHIVSQDSWNVNEDYNIQVQDLHCLHSLQRIHIWHCDQLRALPEWICDLQSLQVINIMDCKCLASFPERMHDLTELQALSLIRVPQLERICRRETGEDWQKIDHIPRILIDGRKI